MSNENKQTKYYRRVIELDNFNLSFTWVGTNKIKWEGTTDNKILREFFDLLFQKYGHVEELDYPPTVFVKPQRKVRAKKTVLSKEERSLLDKVNYRIVTSNFRIVPVDFLDKHYELTKEYPTMIDFNELEKCMKGVFDYYDIKSHLKSDNE